MEKGELIGKGRTAEIFAWGEREVLKLFFDWCPRRWVAEEAKVTGAVHDAGVPAPGIGDVVEVEGRAGIIFERIEGPSMVHAVLSNPAEHVEMGRLMAELQAGMHARAVPGLRPFRGALEGAIRRAKALPDDLKEAAVRALERLPNGQALCHGDLHPDNVILSPRGPVILDWAAAVSGYPLADVARTSLLLKGGQLPPDMPGREQIEAIRVGFYDAWLGRYLEINHASREDIEAWALPVAAARVDEDIEEEQEGLLSLISAMAASGGAG
ncbi:MAG: phosphotransferase family protein [Chloroflexia bacterium]